MPSSGNFTYGTSGNTTDCELSAKNGSISGGALCSANSLNSVTYACTTDAQCTSILGSNSGATCNTSLGQCVFPSEDTDCGGNFYAGIHTSSGNGNVFVIRPSMVKYKGKVKLAYLDFPISQIHEHAELAAEAARCALAQGKYWEMHGAMFAEQSKLDEPSLVKTAERLSLREDEFASCLKSGKYKALVQQDVQAGSQAGVNATPTFFINGEFLSGVRSSADFTRVIDHQLSSSGAKRSTQSCR